MIKLEGKSVFGGVAIGPAAIFRKTDTTVRRETIDDPEAEIVRYHEATEKAKDELQKLYEKALVEVGEDSAFLFQSHQMMLDDLDYVESVENIIRTQKTNAEYAVATTGDNMAEIFAMMDDAYMKERAADVKDVTNRVIGVLSGVSGSGMNASEPVILLADDLAPSETVQLDKSLVLSFVTRHGSTNSHTAILARTMNIPALIGVDYPEDCEGKMAIVDGAAGIIYIDPDEKLLAEYREKKNEEQKKAEL